MAPGDDLAPVVEVGLDIDHLRRADGRPGELVRARPLDAHGATNRSARQQHGIEAHVVGPVVAVAAGALHVLDDDAVGRHRQGERKILAQVVDALAVRPHVHAALAPLGDGAGGRHRGMGDVGPAVGAGDRASLGGRLRRILHADLGGLDLLALDPIAQPRLVGQRLALFPARALLQRFQAGFCRLAGLGDDAHKTAIVHDGDDARNRPRRRLIQGSKPGTG